MNLRYKGIEYDVDRIVDVSKRNGLYLYSLVVYNQNKNHQNIVREFRAKDLKEAIQEARIEIRRIYQNL